MNKKLITARSFPDHLAPDEVKNTTEFGLQMAKAIEAEWFKKPNGQGSCPYYDRRDKFHKLRLYARGEQSTKLYKDLLNGGDDETYSNFDWRPLQIIPKFVMLIVNQMTERLFDIKAEAVDKFSTDMKNSYKESLEDYVISKPILTEAMAKLGVDMTPPDADTLPESQEEIDLHMQLKYKPAIEIAAEEAIKYTLDINDYDETQSRVIEDVTVLGMGAIKHNTDPTKGIVIEYVDPADLIHSYAVNKNFKGVNYFGQVKKISINELKRISNNQFTDEQLKEIAQTSSAWNRYHSFSNEFPEYRDGDLSGLMVDVMYFTFQSVNTISYKKKYMKNGGYKMTKKESTFDKKSNTDGYDVSKKIIDVWYEGILILGTEHLINYKLCENMIRKEGLLNITSSNFIVYAPELYQNRTKSLVERIIPYVDQMQQIHIKLQQLVAKSRPNGIYIDIDGLNEIDMGDGNFLTPLEAIKIYDETGNIIGTSQTAEGDYNYGREPIKELKNGVVDGLDRLINLYNHYLNLLRDAIGIPQGADASMPHPDTLVGVQQQVALNSNTATRHILDSSLNITKRLGNSLTLRLKDIFKYSDLKEVYINAIGKLNVDVLRALEKYHLHDLGILIELKPDAQEKQYLEQNIQQSLAQGLITFDDAVDIRAINNIKLANQLLKVRRVKREKEKREHEKDLIKTQSEGQIQSAQAASQARLQEIQMKAQAEAAIQQAKTQGKITEIQAEAEAKARLMEQEFNYNMTLKGIDTEIKINEAKYKEDRKDSRQDRQNTQSSKIAEQKANNLPAQNFEAMSPQNFTFESSEDNISGGVEMGELEPS